jgi:hypothetical protein
MLIKTTATELGRRLAAREISAVEVATATSTPKARWPRPARWTRPGPGATNSGRWPAFRSR